MSEPTYFMERLRHELQVARELWGKNLFAIYDAAQIEGVAIVLDELQIPRFDLFSYVMLEKLTHVAPQIAEVRLDEIELEWWSYEPNLAAATLFLISDSPLDEVAPHFSRYILVEDFESKEVILRYYDPRVLAPFLNASTASEQRRFFGPVNAMLARDADDKLISDEAAMVVWHHPDHHVDPEVRGRQFKEREEFPFKLRLAHEEAFRKEAREKYIQEVCDYLERYCLSSLRYSEQPEPRYWVERAMRLGPELGLTSGKMVSMLARAILLSDERTVSARLREVPEPRRSVVMREIDMELKAPGATNA